jgi:hypothetical protein
MSEREDADRSGERADLEREIRADRKFSLSEAIGRMAGGGMMKGASPVSPTRQAELVIDDYLRRHLADAGAALGSVVLRRVARSDLLLSDPHRQLVVLAHYVRRVLGSEFLLHEVVRDADVEWGRLLGERPYFQREGGPPHPDDPYTIASVRLTLSRLVETLSAGEEEVGAEQ